MSHDRSKNHRSYGRNNHTAVVYDDDDSYWRLLAAYYQAGFEHNELGVLVVSLPQLQAVEKLRSAGMTDVEKHVIQGKLRIFDSANTYFPNGTFVADYMLGNVINFIEDARDQGFNGIRTAGAMDWLADRSQDRTEAMLYENDVNHVISDYGDFTGLCLYRADETDIPMAESMAHTHNKLVYDGTVHEDQDDFLLALRRQPA